MFKSYFQGGPHVEIFSAQGKDPAAKWKQSGKVQRTFDKGIKSYVYLLEGGPGTKMQLPRDEKLQLSLTQPFIVLQVCVPLGVGFSVQLMVTDTLNSKRRIFLSSVHKEISHTPLHTRLPLAMMVRGQWVNLAVNINSIVTGVFHTTLRSVELICVSASCKLRKIFTMRHQPHNTASGIYTPAYEGPLETIPKTCALNVGTVTQVIDISVISQWVENQQPKTQRETITKSAPMNPMFRSKPSAPSRNAHSAEHHRKSNMANNKSGHQLEAISKQKTAIIKRKPSPKQTTLSPPSKLGNNVSVTGKNARSPVNSRMSRDKTNMSRDKTNMSRDKTNMSRDLARVTSHEYTTSESTIGSRTPEPIKHSTPNPLMDRVTLDMSFTGEDTQSVPVDSTNQHDKIRNKNGADNRHLIDNITNGDLTFRSNSTNTPELTTSPRISNTVAQPAPRHSRDKAYNSEDYQDNNDNAVNDNDDTDSNPFAASDEDLKYRMKALEMFNNGLDDSIDFSVASRQSSKRSMGVGPPALNMSEEEIEERLGEDSDTSSSDNTVLSHAQELLLSGAGHKSFIHETISRTAHDNRQTEAYSPPITFPDELQRQATLPVPSSVTMPANAHNINTTIEEDSDEELDLLYDPVLNCYFDPKTCKYYELA